jgi:hypothetical protein
MRKGEEIQGFGSSAAGMNSGPQPGDFPIGSVESRAAARALADKFVDERPVFCITIEHVGAPPGKSLPPPCRRESSECIIDFRHVTTAEKLPA